MKPKPSTKVILSGIFMFCVITSPFPFFTSEAQPAPPAYEITFYLKNNNLLPKKITLVSYRPDRTGNGTNGFLLMPYTNRKCMYPAGTKLYLATSPQVDTVMSGNRLQDKPFLIVKEEDEGKTFNISE